MFIMITSWLLGQSIIELSRQISLEPQQFSTIIKTDILH